MAGPRGSWTREQVDGEDECEQRGGDKHNREIRGREDLQSLCILGHESHKIITTAAA